jgi:hypothetical protein
MGILLATLPQQNSASAPTFLDMWYKMNVCSPFGDVRSHVGPLNLMADTLEKTKTLVILVTVSMKTGKVFFHAGISIEVMSEEYWHCLLQESLIQEVLREMLQVFQECAHLLSISIYGVAKPLLLLMVILMYT